MTNIVDFFTNNKAEDTPVEANAFSLTKVLIAGGAVVTTVGAWLVDQFTKVNLTSGQFTALVLGVLGFTAVASAADVLARALELAPQSRAASPNSLSLGTCG